MKITLTDPIRVGASKWSDNYATGYAVQSQEPILVSFEGARWRVGGLIVTDKNSQVWVTFHRQTKTGRDVKRGGTMSWQPERIRTGLVAPALADAIDAAVASL